MTRPHPLISFAASLAVVATLSAQIDRGRINVVEKSTDVEWLEKIAGSAQFASEVQGQSPIGMPKALRTAAYVRLGELGTPESVAAAARVEAAAAKTTLTPATV